jgi:hypothetical protein
VVGSIAVPYFSAFEGDRPMLRYTVRCRCCGAGEPGELPEAAIPFIRAAGLIVPTDGGEVLGRCEACVEAGRGLAIA